jgi:hypothetical protein
VASLEVPAEFVAFRVNTVAPRAEVGVPEITQVLALTVKVEGRAEVPFLIPQDVTEAPLALRVVGDTDIAAPTTPVVPVAPE